jgi:hypothetical protein
MNSDNAEQDNKDLNSDQQVILLLSVAFCIYFILT